LPGVPAILQQLLAEGLTLRYVTNNATRHRSEVAAQLAALGCPVTAGQVLTSGAAAAARLREEPAPGAAVLVVGEEGLCRELREAGFTVRRAGTDSHGAYGVAAAVVVGLDRAFTYAGLAEAQQALLSGARFVATNIDPTYPDEDGLLPGAGAIVAAVAAACGREPEVIGKPELGLARVLLRETGLEPGQIVFVGDRLDTDIAMGRRAGMRTVLVLTGVTTRAELTGDAPRPDAVIDTLEDLPAVLASLGPGGTPSAPPPPRHG